MIILEIKGDKFLIESRENLDRNKLNYIVAICQSAYDESSNFNLILFERDSDLYEATSYEIAEIFKEIVMENVGINLDFKNIDIEVKIP